MKWPSLQPPTSSESGLWTALFVEGEESGHSQVEFAGSSWHLESFFHRHKMKEHPVAGVTDDARGFWAASLLSSSASQDITNLLWAV